MLGQTYYFAFRKSVFKIIPKKITKRYQSSSKSTIVLGIETSCDDTGCAIVNDKRNILGEALFSQNVIHLRYGGVNPLVAHELHRDSIENAVNEALDKANMDLKDVDAIAVTTKPGLLLSLQVGVKYAKYLARIHKKPLIPIHHMEAHTLVARMYQPIPFPFLVLLVSGGHCLIAVVKDVNDFLLLGETLDNAPGEVLDKVARRLKLRNIPDYSTVAGGRAVELAAQTANDPQLFKFPLPLIRNRDCNFSFSGLKDSLVRKLLQKEQEHGIMGDGIIPEYKDLCAAFQIAVAEHLINKTERAMLFCEREKLIDTPTKNLVISGGVACNDFIFKSTEFLAKKMGYNAIRPPPRLCTDNGIMIAWNGIEKYMKHIDILSDFHTQEINPVAPLGRNFISKVKAANLPVKVTRLNTLYQI